MKYIQISDFFVDEVNGGAEQVDDALGKFLNATLIKLKSSKTTVDILKANKDHRFVVSNFTMLSEDCKSYLTKECNYIIYEHDHKYLKSRNPSLFKDYICPKDQIINFDFYKNAKAVVCQTNLHAEVVRKNLGLDNIVNFGGSIWTDAELDFLEKNLEKRVHRHELDGWAYQVSENIYKGTREASEWCDKQKSNLWSNGLPKNPIKPCSWEQFIDRLHGSHEYVFFPQVLETCSRVCVEARMLGLKVIGNKNVAALFEPWFKEFKGLELINYFRQKNKSIPEFVEKCFSDKEKSIIDSPEIVTIVTLYRRAHLLQGQIDAILKQSIRPKEIIVWWNYHEDTKDFDISQIKGVDRWIKSNYNWKFFGRFAMAMMAQADYVAFYDDDTIPGPEWHSNCLKTMKTHPGIMGGIGVVLHDENYHDHHRFGWATPEHKRVEEVDLVGHAWFLKKSDLKYIWYEEPYTYDTCEDLHLSYCAQKYGNVKTYVPIQDTKENTSSQLGYELGVDEVATSHPKNHQTFYKQRDEFVKHVCKNGFKRVLTKELK